MKLRIPILTVLLTLFSLQVTAQTMQSDYEIQKSFKAQYSQYQDRVEAVSSTDSAEALITSIREFNQTYSPHADLLDKALYPDTYSQRIEELKRSSVVAKERLETISRQTQKLDKLQTQLSSYEQNMETLNREADSLKKAMQRSVQSEKELSDMVRQYRRSLEKRDELILAFIDSMVVVYRQMDLQATQDLEDMDEKSRLESKGNALQMIHNISVENLEILRKNSAKLRLQDYMRMAEVQQQFQKMWARLGDKIQQVYDGENAGQLANEVDMNINKWKKVLQVQTFASLRDSLAQNNITIGDFQTSDEFFTSLSSYLDNKIIQSKERSSEAVYNDFKRFQRFWNQVEMQWSDNFASAGIISKDQMATLNEKVDRWAETAQPRSNNILVYLLGATALLAVALGVMLIRERKNKGKA